MQTDPLQIMVGKTRVVMRGPMFPSLAAFADGSLMVGAASVEEHSETISIRTFLCAFDCTPPQPWRNHAAPWVGVVDLEVVQE